MNQRDRTGPPSPFTHVVLKDTLTLTDYRSHTFGFRAAAVAAAVSSPNSLTCEGRRESGRSEKESQKLPE